MKLKVETAGVADSVALFITAPERRSGSVAVGAGKHGSVAFADTSALVAWIRWFGCNASGRHSCGRRRSQGDGSRGRRSLGSVALQPRWTSGVASLQVEAAGIADGFALRRASPEWGSGRTTVRARSDRRISNVRSRSTGAARLSNGLLLLLVVAAGRARDLRLLDASALGLDFFKYRSRYCSRVLSFCCGF